VFIGVAISLGLAIGLPLSWALLQFHGPALPVVRPNEVNATYLIKEHDTYWDKLIDPVAVATFLLFAATFGLFWKTAALASETRTASDKTLKASTDAANALVRIERPYVTVGGEYKREKAGGAIFVDENGKKFFRLEVGNYGKTAAVLVAFDVRFDSLENLRKRNSDVSHRIPFQDLLAPGVRHKVVRNDIEVTVDINSGTNVAYGACWYRTALQEEEHVSSFALKLRGDSTWIDDDVSKLDASYRHWD
jgi:hypothetical protein